MEKETINKLLLLITGGSVITFAIGSYIVNHYLSAFHIVDFNLLKPHAIIVGLVFIAFILFNAMIFLLYVDIVDIHSNNLLKVFLLTLVKVAFFTVILSILLDDKMLLKKNDFELFGYNLPDRFIALGFFLVASLPIFIVWAFNDKQKGEKDLINKYFYLHIFLSILSSIIICLIFYKKPIFKDILTFEILIGFMFFAIIALMQSFSFSGKRVFNGTFFSKGPLVEKHHITILKTFSTLCFMFSLLGFMNLYSRIMYPLIGQSYGGGKKEPMTYLVNSDTISGQKLYESEDYIFILNKDSSITKIDWKEVDKINFKNVNSKFFIHDTSSVKAK